MRSGAGATHDRTRPQRTKPRLSVTRRSAQIRTMLETKKRPHLLDPDELAIERIDDKPGYAALLEELRGLE